MSEQFNELNDITCIPKLIQNLDQQEKHTTERLQSVVANRNHLESRLSELSCSFPCFNDLRTSSNNLSNIVAIASALASELSGKVMQLDVVKNRVLDCAHKLEDIVTLKSCANGVQVAFERERFDEAAGYINKFLNMNEDVVTLSERIACDNSVQNAASVLSTYRDKLRELIAMRFDRAIANADSGTIEHLCKLFPLIGQHEDGLDRFGSYLCAVIRKKCNAIVQLSDVSSADKSAVVYVDTLTEILEFIAHTFRENQVYIETYYGMGNLLPVVRSIQTECDDLVQRVLRNVHRHHKLDDLFQTIRQDDGLQSSLSDSSTFRFERILAMEPILTELVLLNTRSELYLRFMRRRLMADLNELTLSESERFDRTSKITALFNNCQMARSLQDLINGYIELEHYFVREVILKAVNSDELDDTNHTLRLADDVFFISKKCLSRTLSSGSVDGICAMFNHMCTVLLNSFVSGTLAPRIRTGFPSGWMQDAYSYVQSSVTAAATTGATTGALSTIPTAAAAGSGNAARYQFLVTLNTIELSVRKLDALIVHLQREVHSMFGQPHQQDKSSVSSGKLQVCLDELKQSVGDQLQHWLDTGLDQLTTSVIQSQAKSLLQPFTSISYKLSEDDLDMCAANDPWIENCVAAIESFLRPFRSVLSAANHDRIIWTLVSEIARRFEQLIQRKSYTRFGAVQLEKELRCLLAYVTSLTYHPLRDQFTRLLQMCNLLNLDSTEEVSLYRNSAAWRLAPNEMRRVLALRTEFSTDEIRRLKL